MYKIKQVPEDFIVREVPEYKPDNEGEYSYFILKKTNWTTLGALQRIAAKLNIPLKQLGFAGTKDRHAATEQLCSAKWISKERLEGINLKGIAIRYVCRGRNPLSLGDLKGNEFVITVRNLEKIQKVKNKKVLNLFGEQRFSTKNAEIGKAIVKKDFKHAVSMVSEDSVVDYLKSNRSDCVGALRTVPLKLRRMYVHAYQSLLWNKTAEELKNSKKNIKVPIMGFGTEIKNKKMRIIAEKILAEEKLSLRDFIIPQMPELSSEGDERDLFVLPKKFKVLEKAKDELNKGKFKMKLAFSLQKGSYATVVIENLFSSPELQQSC